MRFPNEFENEGKTVIFYKDNINNNESNIINSNNSNKISLLFIRQGSLPYIYCGVLKFLSIESTFISTTKKYIYELINYKELIYNKISNNNNNDNTTDINNSKFYNIFNTHMKIINKV